MADLLDDVQAAKALGYLDEAQSCLHDAAESLSFFDEVKACPDDVRRLMPKVDDLTACAGCEFFSQAVRHGHWFWICRRSDVVAVVDAMRGREKVREDCNG